MVIRWAELDAPAEGLRLHVRRVVEPPAPPVMLLHGLGVSGAVWQPFGRRLAPRFAALAPDLRGHGASDAPPTGYQAAEYAADLAALFGPLIQPPAPVVGHSLGALVGLALAEARPALVSALALLDPPLDAGRPNRDVAEVRRLRHAPAGELEAYLLAANPGGGALVAAALAALFRQAADAVFDAMLAAPPGQPESWERAPRVQQPCLVVQADPTRGGLLGDQAARAFAARLPRGRLHKLEGAPHTVHASHPAQLADILLRFLDAS